MPQTRSEARATHPSSLLFAQTHPDEKSQAPQIYGQELTPTTYAMAKMNAFLHDFIGADIQIGDTFRNPRFTENSSSLQRFDYVVANPMWNQKEYDDAFYESDSWNRFSHGIAPSSSADWGWVQHILTSIGVNLAIFDNISLRIRVEVSAPTELGFVKQHFSTEILKKYAETPYQRPQANKPYGIQEVFGVFNVSA